MKAMVLNELSDLEVNKRPLVMTERADPVPGDDDVLIKISACGVCHTELDEIEGRTPPPRLPVVPGHQVVGRVEATGSRAKAFVPGDRVGVAWIHSTCGKCRFCLGEEENLCADFRATGRDVDGGYAQYMTVPEGFAYRVPELLSDVEAAPLLCAGAIGYRSLRLTGLEDGQNLGLTGFGASAHIVLKLVMHRYPSTRVFVFARGEKERRFALELGAFWAGDIDGVPPERLRCIIDTTPVWKPVVEALKNLEPGGRLIINAIRKEEADKAYLHRIDYPVHLWMEKEMKSVANVARKDVREFLSLAAQVPIKPEVEEFDLEDANKALIELKEGVIRGAKVLRV